jgi:hypothetical protein
MSALLMLLLAIDGPTPFEQPWPEVSRGVRVVAAPPGAALSPALTAPRAHAYFPASIFPVPWRDSASERESHEAHVSAPPHASEANPRVSRPQCLGQWPQGSCSSSRQGPSSHDARGLQEVSRAGAPTQIRGAGFDGAHGPSDAGATTDLPGPRPSQEAR